MASRCGSEVSSTTTVTARYLPPPLARAVGGSTGATPPARSTSACAWARKSSAARPKILSG